MQGDTAFHWDCVQRSYQWNGISSLASWTYLHFSLQFWLTWHAAKPRTAQLYFSVVAIWYLISVINMAILIFWICTLQDSVPAGSYNDPFLSSVCEDLYFTHWCIYVYTLLYLDISKHAIGQWCGELTINIRATIKDDLEVRFDLCLAYIMWISSLCEVSLCLQFQNA